mgnify:CR=1 FL=1
MEEIGIKIPEYKNPGIIVTITVKTTATICVRVMMEMSIPMERLMTK